MALNIAVDFDKNDWVALYASATDSVNLFGTVAVSTGDLPRVTQGGGGGSTKLDFGRYGGERSKYGKSYVRWTTGTVVTANILIGFNGISNWTIPANFLPSDMYTLVVWAKREGGDNNNFLLAAYRDSGVLIANGAPTAVSSSEWTKFTFTFSFTATASDDRIYMMFQRHNGSGVSQDVLVAGAMLVAGPVAPSFLNCGSDSLLEPITTFSEEAGWELGFKTPYQYVPPTGRATIKLNNDSKRFSPEYASGPLFGDLVPGLLVQIGDPTYGIKWTGWTENWSPTPGLYGPRDCMLTATDGKVFLDSPLPLSSLTAGFTPGGIVSEYLFFNGGVSVPNTSDKLPVGSSGDVVNWLDVTSETVPYYGDGNEENQSFSKILADIMGGIQGKFWLTRTGGYSRTSSQGINPPASHVNIGAEWMTAVYGDAPIINESNVSVFRRKASAAPVTLWELDETITLAIGANESFRAYFKNTTNDKILVGALSAGLSITHTASGATTVSALSAIAAQSALVTFTNNAAATRDILTASITGTRIVAPREIFKQYQDSTSKGLYGLKAESLRFNWVQSRTWAAKLAKYRVERFKTPRKVMTQIKLNAVAMPLEVQALNIGRAVYVSDAQTAHGAYYAVIGEAHSAKAGLTDQVATFYLEPMYPTTVAATTL